MEATKTVKVAEYREAVEHLERVVNVDFHACVNAAERVRWAAIAQRVGAELLGMSSPRATAADRDRAERVIDRSASRIAAILYPSEVA